MGKSLYLCHISHPANLIIIGLEKKEKQLIVDIEKGKGLQKKTSPRQRGIKRKSSVDQVLGEAGSDYSVSAGSSVFCEADQECQRGGGDYRCIPNIYECKLSYGDCEDGCECMERHKGTNMKCITTITST